MPLQGQALNLLKTVARPRSTGSGGSLRWVVENAGGGRVQSLAKLWQSKRTELAACSASVCLSSCSAFPLCLDAQYLKKREGATIVCIWPCIGELRDVR